MSQSGAIAKAVPPAASQHHSVKYAGILCTDVGFDPMGVDLATSGLDGKNKYELF